MIIIICTLFKTIIIYYRKLINISIFRVGNETLKSETTMENLIVVFSKLQSNFGVFCLC